MVGDALQGAVRRMKRYAYYYFRNYTSMTLLGSRIVTAL